MRPSGAGARPALSREQFDALLLSDDSAAAVHGALADGSLDALVPEIRREMDVPQRTLGRIGQDLEVLERLQLADLASMAPEFAKPKETEARSYHRLLRETPGGR